MVRDGNTHTCRWMRFVLVGDRDLDIIEGRHLLMHILAEKARQVALDFALDFRHLQSSNTVEFCPNEPVCYGSIGTR